MKIRRLLSISVAILALSVPGRAAAQGITQQQADEMLKELRAIRQVLERLTRAAPTTAPTPPARVQLPNVTGFMLGRPDAPVTMVEFTDLQCPFCYRFATTTFGQIKAAYIDTGKLRFVSRDFPLDFHPQAMRAARATRCASDQGKFWDLRDVLVRNAAKLSPDVIDASASGLKLDMTAFRACLASDRYLAEIQRDAQEAISLGLSGTPTFVIGPTTAQGLDGLLIIGAQPFEAFDGAIKDVLNQTAK